MSFEEYLEWGQAGENLIAGWLRGRGFDILPVYETMGDDHKGPRLWEASGTTRVAPDMLVFDGSRVRWIEAKQKTAFTWHRITKRWVTGIDLRHYGDYLSVSQRSRWPVYLLFLQLDGTAKDSPTGCPTGLYGGEIQSLSQTENHRHDNWGTSGMVYWSEPTLTKFAELEDVAGLVKL